MLQKRILGKTGLAVSEIGLGGLFISSYGTERATAREVIRRARELGINYIDTAPGYADSESVLGEALREIDADFIISTKLGYQPEPFQPRNREFLRQAFHRSLQNLHRDSVDMLMIHEPDRPDVCDWWEDREHCRGPVLEVLKELRDEGRCRHIGVGGTTAYEMTSVVASGHFEVLLTAFQYSLLWREAEHGLLDEAGRQRMGIVCGSPLQQGALARLYRNDVMDHPAPWLSAPRRRQMLRLYELVQDLKMPLPELAIRFILSNRAVSCVLTGVRTLAELESSVAAAAAGPLSGEILAELRRIYEMVPFRPYLEPLGLPFKS